MKKLKVNVCTGQTKKGSVIYMENRGGTLIKNTLKCSQIPLLRQGIMYVQSKTSLSQK